MPGRYLVFIVQEVLDSLRVQAAVENLAPLAHYNLGASASVEGCYRSS